MDFFEVILYFAFLESAGQKNLCFLDPICNLPVIHKLLLQRC